MMYRTWRYFKRLVFCFSLVLGLLLAFSAEALSKPDRFYGQIGSFQGQRNGHEFDPQLLESVEKLDNEITIVRRKKRKSPRPGEEFMERNWKNYRNLSPDEKARIKRNYQEWKSLPPEKQKALRRRMEQWRGLSPDDRALYEQIFRQWQKLSPEERKRIREKLEKWNGLSTAEKDQIRGRFRDR